ncbi:SusC/RagA family TonB-linked outer membrane protein [Sphingobacterium griseoflavum]|nr:SusC/RagA family TonB-linked outer membrane protein [Sphingobacterium griseoflavum]
MKKLWCFLCIMPLFGQVVASTNIRWQDTVQDQAVHEILLKSRFQTLYNKQGVKDSVRLAEIENLPFLSPVHYTKGQVAGLYVQEANGEPGTPKNMTIRGLGTPIFSQKDAVQTQPTIYVNGVPIARENNFTYAIQQYQFNRLGPAADNFAGIDLSTVASIEVIKDPVRLAKLGPLAANGAIWILTKAGKEGRREISFNSYFGISTPPSVTPVNAQYENYFRQQFYSKYGSLSDRLTYPGYLNDSTNINYYGPANWNQSYYQNQPLYNANLGIRGGSERANFAFYGGYTNNGSTADETRFRRYHALFNVNMAPFEWFNMGAVVNANRNTRDRNRSLRDRFGEAAYVPDLSVPMSPNRNVYEQYLDVYNQAIDDNIVNSGQALLTFDVYFLRNLKYNTSLGIDYSEGYRDVFFPSSLMERNNYMSNYFGYSQRYLYSNKLTWDYDTPSAYQVNLSLGSIYQEDLYRYSYARAYDGPNDFVKINVVEGNSNESGYLQPVGGLYVSRWSNREDYRMHSVYLSGAFRYKNRLEVDALLRYDGSSTVQPDSRWLFTPAVSAKYDMIEKESMTHGLLSQFTIGAGWARIGKPTMTSRYAIGPNYVADLAWGSESGLVSYNGFAVASRPYSEGWIGYGMDWPYTEHASVDLDAGFLANRLNARLSGYLKKDQNQVVPIPVPAEYGYDSQLLNGLSVQNSGLELTLAAQILTAEKGLKWNSSLNFNWNRNKLTALPNGLQELAVGQRKLQVGHAIDQFWLFENKGTYVDQVDIPVQNGERLQFEGVPFEVGDPVWKDQNGDFKIDQDDRVMRGHAMPKLVGAFQHNFSYQNFDLAFQFYFALGHQALNQRASSKYDFVNNEASNSLAGIREVFHWQQDVDIRKYPIYNPWSAVVPYRVEQDLFLEDASFLKLRSVSLSYDLAKLSTVQNRFKSLRKAALFITGTNLLTWTKFSGGDPELIDFDGYYSGYGLPMAPVTTIGVKIEL